MCKSLYIHIPFCRRRCIYCDFYSLSYKESAANSLINTLCRQIAALEPVYETIYVGGGTPTALSFPLLKKLFIQLLKVSRKALEFTVEANPESLSKDKIRLFADYRVNRLSVGCQSFNFKKLQFLERAHTRAQAVAAVENVKKYGFENISLDLIFGLPIESDKTWKEDLKQAVNLPVKHLSFYMLTYEEKTRLYEALRSGKFTALSDEKVAFMYQEAIAYLFSHGFKQYEISNFSQKGFRCQHNFRYWLNEPYLGLGPSAVSFWQRRRQKNISSVAKYIEAVKSKARIWDYHQELSELESARETAALKIRTTEGINLKWFKEKTGFALKDLLGESFKALLREKLIRYERKREIIALTQKGTLFADTVSSEFL